MVNFKKTIRVSGMLKLTLKGSIKLIDCFLLK